MKYEFHIGDYVETVEGEKGYLSRYQVLSNGNIVFYVRYKNEKIYPCDVTEDGLKYRFNRIGQYNFTKKDEDKIEPLACETASDYSNEKLRKKINELVEAVNRLEEKVNGMA